MSDKKNNHGKHILMILICCLVMFSGFWFMTGLNNRLNSGWSWLVLLLCPLMHLFMMKGYHNYTDED